MPDSRPEAADLAEIVRDWIKDSILPGLEGDARFQGLIAMSLLAMIARETRLKPEADAAERTRLRDLTGGEGGLVELNRQLCAKIDRGEIAVDDPVLLRHLAGALHDALAINNPRWLTPPAAKKS